MPSSPQVPKMMLCGPRGCPRRRRTSTRFADQLGGEGDREVAVADADDRGRPIDVQPDRPDVRAAGAAGRDGQVRTADDWSATPGIWLTRRSPRRRQARRRSRAATPPDSIVQSRGITKNRKTIARPSQAPRVPESRTAIVQIAATAALSTDAAGAPAARRSRRRSPAGGSRRTGRRPGRRMPRAIGPRPAAGR